MTSFRKFLSIAAQCGDGPRPELQALFERLAVDPHSELFVRNDGMVQSGPYPVSAEAPLPQTTVEARASNVDSSRHFVLRKNSSPQAETLRVRGSVPV
jgi:hypothetical protein